ncbi:FAD/NAD(P)-binding domain-containing protein [Mycena belliarum]|uniref:FAD/NAD(P)-binding domain-containing protein n=1 Tax=Mycena belliarum TaxID=1033014 RepID=A0AAD6U6K5_9AGAR|nr:FAD/NAD(P)-binding domain-containing protein [Mycena belliae]
MTPDESLAIAVQWLASLGASTDAAAFADHFAPTGWLRDLLCFSWDFSTMSGRAKILEFLADAPAGGESRFARAGLHNFSIDVVSKLGPPAVVAPLGNPNGLGISAVFTFSVAAPPAKGRGFVRLIPDSEGGWQAFTLFTDLQHLDGHAEPSGRPVGYLNITWEDAYAAKVAAIERDPTVLIVGAGQAGLMCAARLGRMGIRALVLEKTARVGDVWRNRETYPEFLPRDKIADFLEAYAVGQEIHVWRSSAMLPGPTYDSSTDRWSVEIDRAGKRVTLTPKHIVFATGIGKPKVPTWPGIDSFRGPVYHSDDHKGAAPFEGKNVIVVGGCNAGADMCKDFVHKGAAEVTMVQRSATCVVSARTADELMFRPLEHLPSEDSDFMSNATPPALTLKLAAGGGTQRMKALDKELHDNLAKAGFQLTWQLTPGGEEVGFPGMFLERAASGSMIDVGFGQLIIDSKVKVKPVDIERIEPDGMVFKDGSKIPADVIVLATGNEPIIAGVASIFGDGIAERIGSKVWGLDNKGELTNCYKPTGVAGLWFATGAFQYGRYLSRHLAIQILAKELGLKD